MEKFQVIIKGFRHRKRRKHELGSRGDSVLPLNAFMIPRRDTTSLRTTGTRWCWWRRRYPPRTALEPVITTLAAGGGEWERNCEGWNDDVPPHPPFAVSATSFVSPVPAFKLLRETIVFSYDRPTRSSRFAALARVSSASGISAVVYVCIYIHIYTQRR